MNATQGGMVSRVVAIAVVLGLAVALAPLVGRGVRAGTALAEGPAVVPETGGEERNRPLSGLVARDLEAPGAVLVSLGELGDGLVMVFDTACGPCASNMGNWADLVRDARGRRLTPLALTVEPAHGAAEYWQGWAGVRVLAADTATLRNDLRLMATPTTLVVEDGVVRRSYVGPLSPAAKRELTDWIRRR